MSDKSLSQTRKGQAANGELRIGPVVVKSGMEAPRRMSVLIWGPAACGKTTFAATAPGNKLWLSFGDQEHVSVMHRPDVQVADLSGLTTEELFKHAKSDNPFGLDQILALHTDIQTIVCDSATSLVGRALSRAIELSVGASRRGFTPTIEEPGQAAYGARNSLMMTVINGLMRVTAKHGVHLIVTAHEADPIREIRNGQEFVSHISIMLGGQLVNNMTFRLSEIWYMSLDLHKEERKLAVRSGVRRRQPMKTRMFSSKGEAEFVLKYDADKPDKGQMTIAHWFDEWRKRGEKIIPNSGQ